jgi:hypothetical protein
VTTLAWDDGEMAVFAAGRYVHGVFGKDSATVLEAALDMQAATAGTAPAAGTSIEPVPAEPDSPFPELGVAGWRPPQRVDRFTPDNLYAKIDGRADAYIQFNVVGLSFGTYYHESASDRTIDVYWYDMGEGVNAFGIYQAEAPPELSPVEIGREGYQAGGAVFFWEGGSYVQVLPAGSDDGDREVALEIARAISGRLDDSGGEMWALDVLPADGRVGNSLAFLAKDAFGLDFLAEVFTARYEVDGVEITMFVHRAADEEAARALLEEYGRFFETYGKLLDDESGTFGGVVAGTVAGVTDAVFVKGRYLGGVAGADDPDQAREAAKQFYDALAVP